MDSAVVFWENSFTLERRRRPDLSSLQMRPSSLGNVGIVRQSPIIRESEIVDDGVACPIASSQQQQREDDKEYLFELAPLGTEDLLARCREGPGNWWGDVDDDSLRVDDRGRVVLVDPEMYFEVKRIWGVEKKARCKYSSSSVERDREKRGLFWSPRKRS